MKTPEQKRIERLESALKVIRTWAGFWFENTDYERPDDLLRDIQKKAEDALNAEK